MRIRKVGAVLALVMLPGGPVLACGAMVSDSGDVELTGIEALLDWDGETESLLVSISFQTEDPRVGWLMPLPQAPDIEESDRRLIEEAFAITAPPVEPGSDDDEGAGAPQVGAAPGVDVVGRDTIGGLRFVTLSGGSAGEIGRWMRRHGFGFHDRQEPVLQDYLDRSWVVVAARVAPGKAPAASLVPVRFTFDTREMVYPLAMAGSSHSNIDLRMTLFVLTPFRPSSTTYPESVSEPRRNLAPALPGDQVHLRYAAPLGDDAERMEATPETWLTRYEATFHVGALTQDLVLAQGSDQSPVDYAESGEQGGYLGWVTTVVVIVVAAALAVAISLSLARRRRAAEAPRMPGSGPSL